jgi:hypothetical protein
MPRKTFVAGDVLQASEVNTFLMNQAVMTFASESARNTAITLPVDGMVTYLEDTKRYQTYNGTAWVTINQINSFSDVPGVSLSTPTAGQKLVFDGTNWVNLTGYVYVDTVYFTSSGTFTKATYPWLRAIRVKCVGGGGGGGGAQSATPGTNISAGSGGGGGAYAESFITDIAGLAASVTVTRGAGGAGGFGTASGSNGTDSVFGTNVEADAGSGGGGGAANSGVSLTFSAAGSGGAAGSSTGDLKFSGADGVPGAAGVSGNYALGGLGGSTALSGASRYSGATSANGQDGKLYGGGGSGAQNRTSGSTTGGSGADGIVIVELYA